MKDKHPTVCTTKPQILTMNNVCLKMKQEIDDTKVFVHADDVMAWVNNKIELEENLNR